MMTIRSGTTLLADAEAMTQHTPADVRGRIIRASILPIEDEETMIARLRAGAEAVERGELDVDDFVGVWSQYLRQLLRASSVPAPADVRERVAKIVREAMEDARRSERLNTFLQSSMWDYADRILALLHTPRGEGERVKGAWATVEAAALAQANLLDSNFAGQSSKAAEIRNAVEQVAALLRTPSGERPAGPLDAAEWADLDETVPLPEPLTDDERVEGLARIRADRMRRTSGGEGEEALAAEVIRLNTALALLKTEENAAHVEAVATNAAWLEELERIAAFATRTPALRLDAALCSEAQGEEDAVRRTWELAVRRAYGCLDYCGGYRGAELKAFHSGIMTVIRALEAGLDTVDTQTAALDRIGAARRGEGGGK